MRQRWTDPAAIEAEIARIRSLSFDALRRRWQVVFGRTPPVSLSKDLLGRMIARRMQEEAFGGLDRESLTFLDGLARHGGSPRRRLPPRRCRNGLTSAPEIVQSQRCNLLTNVPPAR